jgi:hypothetical protein
MAEKKPALQPKRWIDKTKRQAKQTVEKAMTETAEKNRNGVK